MLIFSPQDNFVRSHQLEGTLENGPELGNWIITTLRVAKGGETYLKQIGHSKQMFGPLLNHLGLIKKQKSIESAYINELELLTSAWLLYPKRK